MYTESQIEQATHYSTVDGTLYREKGNSVYHSNSKGQWCGMGAQSLWLRTSPIVEKIVDAS